MAAIAKTMPRHSLSSARRKVRVTVKISLFGLHRQSGQYALALSLRRVENAELDQAAHHLVQDGICVLPRLFEPELIAAWAAAFGELFAQRQRQRGGLAPRDNGRYDLTLPWTQPLAPPRVFANAAILGLVERVLAPQRIALDSRRQVGMCAGQSALRSDPLAAALA